MHKVGIDAISFYTPSYYLDLATLAKARNVDIDKFYIGIGQQRMSVAPFDEDVVTMAADAANKALETVDKSEIGTLLFATETGVDQSKSSGMFVHKLLELPNDCRVLELKQACYSATGGLQLALALLQQRPNKKILLIASDIARYGLNTPAEPSQGAAAVAMVLSVNPRIVSIEPESGIHADDAMDFWRPNYRTEALVNGRYSCDLYIRFLHKTWKKYHKEANLDFNQHDYFCYHISVPRLVEKAHTSLYKYLNKEDISDITLTKHVSDSLKYSRVVGNCYTSAMYLGLMSLLENNMADLTGKKLFFYSYGSGSVAESFGGTVQPGYEKYLHKEYHQSMITNRKEISQEQYEAWHNYVYPEDGSSLVLDKEQKGKYRLASIEKHMRLYETLES